jgi:ATP-dependent Clp protease ATP-binding subunit ClpA
MLSSSLERTLQAALALASAQRHEYATLEHLLLALLDDADAQMALRACHTDLAELRTGLTGFIEDDLTGLVTTREGKPKPTTGFQRVVQRAAIRVQAAGQDEVTGAHALLALFSERESHAAYFLQQQGVTESGLTETMAAAARRPGRIFVALTAGPETANAWMQGYLPAIRAAGHQAEPPLPTGLAEGVTEAVLSQIRKSQLLGNYPPPLTSAA